jgi:hypothetical protein
MTRAIDNPWKNTQITLAFMTPFIVFLAFMVVFLLMDVQRNWVLDGG